jgi:hypothetical protein
VIDGERIRTTEDHPFWSVTDQMFEDAQDLAPGEKVLAADGRVIEVVGLDAGSAGKRTAYNLTVEELHTYYVGASDVLVHNCGGAAGNGFKGGRYRDLPTGNGIEVHHMPADSISPLTRADGPAIQMERLDHYQTGSCGRSKSAQGYRAEQERLIGNGRFDDAIQMDIDDVTSKFPGKYDDAILGLIDRL